MELFNNKVTQGVDDGEDNDNEEEMTDEDFEEFGWNYDIKEDKE